MTSTVTQWHEYLEQEKVMWLIEHVLESHRAGEDPLERRVVPDNFKLPAYDFNLVMECERCLTQAQRDKYIQYMSSAIAAVTYEGLTPVQINQPETGDKFYWNYLTAPVDLRGRCIWNAVADFAP